MSEMPWISPARVSKMLVHDKTVHASQFGYATLRNNAKRADVTTSTLARAKLQPQEPTAFHNQPAGLWPVTASAERLVLAPGVSYKPSAFEAVFGDYDARVTAKQDLLAVVLTMHFPHCWTQGDILSLVSSYCLEMLALKRQLTTLVSLHNPADGLSARPPHAHCVVLSRKHRASGWAEVDADLRAGDAAQKFEHEWASYKLTLAPRFRSA